MRIIGGNLKGKKIFLPKDKKTRPLRDLVKESIFNLIEHSKYINLNIDSLNILDLFSGSGSFGIECISRGAKKVVFIEEYFEALKILKKNIIHINLEEKCTIIEKNCFNFFQLQKKKFEKFDLIFMDPPYKEKKINSLIKKIKELEILNKKGIIIIHRHHKDDIEISEEINILDVRKYGISKIIIGN